ncbi:MULTISPECIES: LCP family protein [unclassified Thermoactinomyces]|uniref:LCP family protein n=1 Tax=unclassified Thermoactinomyces TaxID=2634588 RepID=UPI0018DD033F|nr:MULTISPECIES: LCP family protein [unclassified Thermoactinomyces]MBH8597791.1 LCP family protein [Thermoactinomyces sp. CICC 10523]MBH8604142.1 LCP family protein [Thermoactinomyces sp. CICC 10522]
MADQIKSPVKKKKGKRIFLTLLSIVILVCVALGFSVAWQMWGALAANSGKKLPKSDMRTKQVEMKKDPFTVLLIGTDQRGHSKDWRTDVLILAAVNPENKSVKVVSIPRDLYVTIPNTNGMKGKINWSAAYGTKVGPVENTRKAIENLLQVPVDSYAKINFQGFENIVDALGGVDVNVKFPFHQRAIGGKMVYFEPGKHHLNGAEALAYVRMRHQDPRGDLGRNERQREVIATLIDQIASTNGLLNFGDVMKAVGNNFEMSFNLSDIPGLINLYRTIPKENIETVEMKVTFDRIPGVGDVDILHSSERQRVITILQDQLNFHPEPDGNAAIDSEGSHTGVNGTEESGGK